MKIYNVLIVEDEIPAQVNLQKAIEKNFGDLKILGLQNSVHGTVEWLREHAAEVDIIFMDVELSDGMCFDIFSQVSLSAKVIITTAYDTYAVKAFRVNSMDYLLKPVDYDELKIAVDKCRKSLDGGTPITPVDLETLKDAILGREPLYKKRFIAKFGTHIVVIHTEQIAYFYTEDKSTCLSTLDNRQYVLDNSLDEICEMIDPGEFFRISRHCIVSENAIKDIVRHASNRLKLELQPDPGFEIFVSRSRTNDFMTWLEER
ncbi:LytTR family DNA-binding domain-containing protein [Alistipes sp.]|uniref:LytR/AlgR family response regulator transcription factor n=1 Tax=Alistipes sp. TaxID=1872444 RepID=UPI0025C42F1B|nr:LytTR family DNA-binding domain-containing protein [Alistipes sp.]